jgi:hypothetical protein
MKTSRGVDGSTPAEAPPFAAPSSVTTSRARRASPPRYVLRLEARKLKRLEIGTGTVGGVPMSVEPSDTQTYIR